MNITEETKAHAQDVLNYIKAHPEKHDQADWLWMEDSSGESLMHQADKILAGKASTNVCKTTMCVAGTSVWLKDGYDGMLRARTESRGRGADVVWERRGSENLGLNSDEATWLFYDTNNEDAVEALEFLAAGDEQGFYHFSGLRRHPRR